MTFTCMKYNEVIANTGELSICVHGRCKFLVSARNGSALHVFNVDGLAQPFNCEKKRLKEVM